MAKKLTATEKREKKRQSFANFMRSKPEHILRRVASAYEQAREEAYRFELLDSDMTRKNHFLKQHLRKENLGGFAIGGRDITYKQAAIVCAMTEGRYGGIKHPEVLALYQNPADKLTYRELAESLFLATPSNDQDMENLISEYDESMIGGN